VTAAVPPSVAWVDDAVAVPLSLLAEELLPVDVLAAVVCELELEPEPALEAEPLDARFVDVLLVVEERFVVDDEFFVALLLVDGRLVEEPLEVDGLLVAEGLAADGLVLALFDAAGVDVVPVDGAAVAVAEAVGVGVGVFVGVPDCCAFQVAYELIRSHSVQSAVFTRLPSPS
jgi:hypothetical protein